MNRGFFRKILLLGGALLLSLALAAHPALVVVAQPFALDIISVFVDFGGATISINGMNFDNGRPPVVTLGDQSLTVNSFTSQKIKVGLPSAILDGDYLLTVTTGSSSNQVDFYDLTIGAVGPQGPPGPQGTGYFSGMTKVVGHTVEVKSGQEATSQASCRSGWRVLGGGYNIHSGGGRDFTIMSSEPRGEVGHRPMSWQVRGRQNHPPHGLGQKLGLPHGHPSTYFQAAAVCAKLQ